MIGMLKPGYVPLNFTNTVYRSQNVIWLIVSNLTLINYMCQHALFDSDTP